MGMDMDTVRDMTAKGTREGTLSRPGASRWCERRIAALGKSHLDILEAGCGRRWKLDLGDVSRRIVGVDLNEAALNLRLSREQDLDEAVVGDIAQVDLPDHAYDVIYCSFLLEHVPDAGRVLEQFSRWIRPGGLIIITIPDRRSVYGFFTRLTPHWFHVLYKRWFSRLGKNAGKPGFGPYRTIYDPVLSRVRLRAFFAERGLTIVDEAEFGTLDGWQGTFARLVALASFGYLSADHVDLLYVVQA